MMTCDSRRGIKVTNNWRKGFLPYVASKKSSNQKTLLYNHVKKTLISDTKCLYFFDPTSF